jgi:hypothetical protein
MAEQLVVVKADQWAVDSALPSVAYSVATTVEYLVLLKVVVWAVAMVDSTGVQRADEMAAQKVSETVALTDATMAGPTEQHLAELKAEQTVDEMADALAGLMEWQSVVAMVESLDW